MTLRQFVYRFLYLKSPGWHLTRAFRLRSECQKCGQTEPPLHLHHLSYPFFNVWYRLFWLVLAVWIFYDVAMWAVVVLLVTPDLISPTKTLCVRCHELAEKRKKR